MVVSHSSDRFRVSQIDHVEMFVPDRGEAARWYAEVLGLAVVPGYDDWASDPQGPLMISSDGAVPNSRCSRENRHRQSPRRGFNWSRFAYPLLTSSTSSRASPRFTFSI